MIAFTIFGRPIYWYGIFYLITFFCGYQFLLYLGKTKRFAQCKGLQSLLTDKIDDLVFVALLGVILGGRLGHVLLYEFSYYLTHPSEILSIWQGGMSFIGGVIGVVIGLIYLTKKISLSKTELFLLGDIILCVVPIGSMLGRIGNFLNQELWGLPVDNLPTTVQSIIKSVGLEYVYTSVDDQVRVNTNFFQSFLEGFVILCVTWAVMFGMYIKKHIRPGMITGLFFVLYGIFRFIAEFLKDLPVSEMKGVFSVSQRVMIGFILIGSYFLMQSKKNVQ